MHHRCLRPSAKPEGHEGLRAAAAGLALASLVVLGGCSVGSERAVRQEPAMPIPDVAPVEVLAVVATPSVPEPTATAEPSPTPAPTPTLTASRVVVHTSGDWLIDGDQLVTVHESAAGEPIGAVAVGVLVSATGAGRVLDGVTWVEVTLPDEMTGYVRSSDLRVAHRERPTPNADARDLLGDPAPESTAEELGPETPLADPTVTPVPTATVAPLTPVPPPPDDTPFVLSSFDPADSRYVVTQDGVVFWAEYDNELVEQFIVNKNVVIDVTAAEGRTINGIAMVRARFQNVDGWIDIQTIRRLNP